MNSKVLIGLLIFIILISGGIYFGKNFIGDVRPALLPSTPIKLSTSSPDIHSTIQDSNLPFILPNNFKMGVFVQGLEKPRDLQFSPNGTLLVSNMGAGQVLALVDKNNDGIADEKQVIISNLDNPHGLAFFNDKLFVASETSVNRYNWDEQNLTATFDKKVLNLPTAGGHFTRSIIFDSMGKMYVSIGSTCNVCVEDDPMYASVIISESEGSNPKVYASGLRNAVFLTKKPNTDQIWVTEMGRDLLGDNLPPEEINILQQGDYGWPYCYGDKVRDNTFQPNSNTSCTNMVSPVSTMTAHSAPLGLTFIDNDTFPAAWKGDLLVAQHGSWNRSTPSGYKVIRMNVEGDKIVGQEDFITGFLQGSSAVGRPVDLEFAKDGSLYLSDDKSGAIYKIIHSK